MSGFENDIETDGIPTPSGEMASSSVSATLVSRESVIMADSEPELERGLKVQIKSKELEQDALTAEQMETLGRLVRATNLKRDRNGDDGSKLHRSVSYASSCSSAGSAVSRNSRSGRRSRRRSRIPRRVRRAGKAAVKMPSRSSSGSRSTSDQEESIESTVPLRKLEFAQEIDKYLLQGRIHQKKKVLRLDKSAENYEQKLAACEAEILDLERQLAVLDGDLDESHAPSDEVDESGTTSAAPLARISQAGPHKCSRINPSTSKPCNTVFSRPYDLTRHEDTVHNNRKKKMQCPHCREEKTFSRKGHLKRHMRVRHPEAELYGKSSAPGEPDSSPLDGGLKSLPHTKELEHVKNDSMDNGRRGSPFGSQECTEIKREVSPPDPNAQVSEPEHRMRPRTLIHAAPSVSNPPPSADTKKDMGVSQCHEDQETAQSQGNHPPGLRTCRLEGKLATILRTLTRWCRPTPWRNHSRLEWHCCCGRQFWGDFRSDDPEKLHRLVFELQRHGFAVDTATTTTTVSGTLPTTGTTTSSQANPTGVSTPSPNDNPLTSMAVKRGTSATPSGTSSPAVRQATTSVPVSLQSIGKPVYLELCINRSPRVTRLGEIIIVDGMGQQLIHTDLELFASIRDKYNSMKRKGLFALLYQPCDIHYVQFGTQISAQQTDIYQKPEVLPPDIEVIENRYHYHECPLTPLPPMPPQTFYQYFRQHAPDCASRSTLFSDRLPKKLGDSMTLQNSADKLVFGWGIHIIEGPNKPVLSILVAVILTLSFAISVIYDVCTGNADSGFAIGQWIVAVLSAVLTAIYFHLQGQ